MSETPFADLVIASILLLAIVRGIWIGLIREGLSIAAIGAATIVTRLAVDPLSTWITDVTGGEISGRASLWIAGVILVVATILAVGSLAKFMRLGARFAGLGWADRAGGGALGLAEGAVVSTILLLIALWLVGPDHPALAGSRSLAVLEDFRATRGNENALDMERFNAKDLLPHIAAPKAD